MSDTTKQFRRQLPRNSFFQILSFCIQVGVGIWLVPYLVNHLGTAAYGLIPIAGMFTQYISLISQSISAAVSRFLTIALQKDDGEEANRIFSTAFYTYLAIGILQVPLFALILYFADSLIDIPRQLYYDAVILLACSALVFIVNLITSIFGVPVYANNRLDISRGIDISRYMLRPIGIAMLFMVMGPALRYVGYVDLAIALFLSPVQVMIARRLAPNLRLRARNYDLQKIRQLTGMGGWLVVNNVGTLLFLRMDVWICNRFVGPEAAGEYAALLQWPTLIRHGGAIIAAVIAPMIVIYFAKSEMRQLVRLSKVAVRTLSLILTVPIAIICVFSDALLALWLGDSFKELAPLMIVMLFHLGSNVGILPLFNIQVAMNKVRLPAMVTLIMGIFNVALAIAFIHYFDLGIMGVAIAGAIVLTAKNAIWMPLYASTILQVPWHTFVKPCISALGLLTGLMAAGYVLKLFFAPETWLQLFVLSVCIGILGMAAMWIIIPVGDRHLMHALLPERFRANGIGKQSDGIQ